MLGKVDYDVAISTGAALALAVLPVARASGRRAVYIESISRFDGPSFTGRTLSRIPGISLYTQHSAWSSRRWKSGPSVLSEFSVGLDGRRVDAERLRVFVTLGTIKPYRFKSLVEKVIEILPASAEITWQLGETAEAHLPGDCHSQVSAEEFDQYIRESDVVISHAGVGSTIRIMELGKLPVLVPRRRVRNEHVDDHQVQVARELGRLGLVEYVEVSDLTLPVLLRAASRVVKTVRSDSAPAQNRSNQR
ncbi:MAG: glycosyltransferase [Alcaligenaceae bacterium]|nr:MAG: glycosyltransferase [Alcaligenaceae bacterium]